MFRIVGLTIGIALIVIGAVAAARGSAPAGGVAVVVGLLSGMLVAGSMRVERMDRGKRRRWRFIENVLWMAAAAFLTLAVVVGLHLGVLAASGFGALVATLAIPGRRRPPAESPPAESGSIASPLGDWPPAAVDAGRVRCRRLTFQVPDGWQPWQRSADELVLLSGRPRLGIPVPAIFAFADDRAPVPIDEQIDVLLAELQGQELPVDITIIDRSPGRLGAEPALKLEVEVRLKKDAVPIPNALLVPATWIAGIRTAGMARGLIVEVADAVYVVGFASWHHMRRRVEAVFAQVVQGSVRWE